MVGLAGIVGVISTTRLEETRYVCNYRPITKGLLRGELEELVELVRDNDKSVTTCPKLVTT